MLMVPPRERLVDDHEPTNNLSRWMWAWSDQAEAWGYSFWDKDPPPRGSGTNIPTLRCGH